MFFVFLPTEKQTDMIQEIKVKNFLSFKDEVTLSFEATKDTFADERIMRKSIRDRFGIWRAH